MAEIELINVSKSWGDFNAVKNFNLIIKDKEFLVLLGPSGCGKTTTMRMIAGLEDLTNGVIKIGSKIVNDLEPKDRDVSMVFQSYGLYPNMTVYENVRFPLKIRKDLIKLCLLLFHENKARIPLKKRIRKFPLSPVKKTKTSEINEIHELNKKNLFTLKLIKAMRVQ